MKRALRLAVVTLLSVVTSWSPAGATVYVPTELSDLVRASPTIVRAVVVDVTADRSDVRGKISSVVTLEAEAYVKGNLGPLLRIRVPGGRVGRYENIVMGAPRFAAGQRVIVFLDARPPQLPHLVRLGQGVFRILARPDGPYVTPPAVSADAPVAASGSSGGRSGDGRPLVRGDGARREERLEAFERRVAALVAQGER